MAVDFSKQNPEARPSRAFDHFRKELNETAPFVSYGFSEMKAQSCGWMIDRIPAGGTGVDVGGTEFLCERLSEKGCDVTFYDFGAPQQFPKFIEDDMFNVLDHFEEKSLDFVTTRHTLEHALVPLFQLWAYNRLLKDDGRLLVIVPQYNTKWLWFHTHFSCLPVDSWHMLFYRAGFRIVSSDTAPWHPTRKAYIENRFELAIETRSMRLDIVDPKSELPKLATARLRQQLPNSSGNATEIKRLKQQISVARASLDAERENSKKQLQNLKSKMRFWRPANWKYYIHKIRKRLA